VGVFQVLHNLVKVSRKGGQHRWVSKKWKSAQGVQRGEFLVLHNLVEASRNGSRRRALIGDIHTHVYTGSMQQHAPGRPQGQHCHSAALKKHGREDAARVARYQAAPCATCKVRGGGSFNKTLGGCMCLPAGVLVHCSPGGSDPYEYGCGSIAALTSPLPTRALLHPHPSRPQTSCLSRSGVSAPDC